MKRGPPASIGDSMSTYRLDKLFSPRSVAVVGASPRESSAGHAVLRNLRRGGFAGAIHLVNPRYDAIEGIPASKSYDKLPAAPDVAIIVVPAAAVVSIGDSIDVDFADLLDHFAMDRAT